MTHDADLAVFFNSVPSAPSDPAWLDVLPTSVVDIAAQGSGRRGVGGHDSDSSRSTYSHFPVEIGTLAFQLFLRDAALVFDPFAGWGERAALAQKLNRCYLGFDISQKAIDAARERYGVENSLADSETAVLPEFDGLLTCPPYWNLERYSPEGLDDPSWESFIARIGRVWARCYAAAKLGAVLCVYAGDWRAKHRYYDFTYRTQETFAALGAVPVDVVIGSRAKVTKIKILIPQARRLGYTVKVHETLLVWRKP